MQPGEVIKTPGFSVKTRYNLIFFQVARFGFIHFYTNVPA